LVIRDTATGYGLVTRTLHWLMALAIFFLFGLGYWMVGLDYYSPYYVSAPDLHRSLGLIVGLMLVVRLVWVASNEHPSDAELSPFERLAARAAHWSFYPLILLVVASGYFIATSDGRPINVFGLVTVPSIVADKSMTDLAGLVHRYSAYATIALAILHALAALKHHFLDRSSILSRMLTGPPS